MVWYGGLERDEARNERRFMGYVEDMTEDKEKLGSRLWIETKNEEE